MLPIIRAVLVMMSSHSNRALGRTKGKVNSFGKEQVITVLGQETWEKAEALVSDTKWVSQQRVQGQD